MVLCKWCLKMSVNLVKLANIFQCNIFTFKNKIWTGYHINIAKKNPFSGVISHGASDGPEVFLEPSQASMTEHFAKIVNG